MRPCKILPHSSARPAHSRILRYSNRRYFAAQAQHDDHSESTHTPTDADPTKGPLASDRDDAFEIDSIKKTVATAVGELPLSPVMDPSFWEAKRRHQVRKAKPGKPQNSVERQLRANPFAKALATPQRQCAVTRIRLPKFFLQDFSLIAHPETGDPWWVPRSLALREQPATEEPDAKGIHEAMNEATMVETEEKIEETISKTEGSEKLRDQDMKHDVPSENGKPYGPSGYTLARRDLLSSFNLDLSGFRNGQKKLMSGTSSRYKPLAGKAMWRGDMDTFILEQMQQDIVNDLLYLSRLCVENQRYYIVKCYGWGDVQYKHKGAVLWFGEPDEAVSPENQQNRPGPFATFDIQGEAAATSVVVHNMPMLLGSEKAEHVKKDAAILKDGSIFMLAGRRTTNIQMKLWRLQGYLADYRDEA
ncbi:hypothetical protein F4779DRAFT_619898 [Xylariaceae sp. FL0662B]|nr:hypothetical protein F4779DRAFT_619898 [Xylariaceae sp. FL0662B]